MLVCPVVQPYVHPMSILCPFHTAIPSHPNTLTPYHPNNPISLTRPHLTCSLLLLLLLLLILHPPPFPSFPSFPSFPNPARPSSHHSSRRPSNHIIHTAAWRPDASDSHRLSDRFSQSSYESNPVRRTLSNSSTRLRSYTVTPSFPISSHLTSPSHVRHLKHDRSYHRSYHPSYHPS